MAAEAVEAFKLGPGELLAIVTGIAALVTAIGTAIANVIVATRTGRQVSEIASKTDVVVAHVNSAATAAAARIEALQNEVRAMREEVTGGEKRAALLAQASATRRALEITSNHNQGVSADPQLPPPTVVLDQPIAVTVLPTEVPPDGTDK